MKIVLIDDERHCRVLLKSYLAEIGINPEDIYEAKDVNSGVEIIESVHPDILFLDIQLGQSTGFDLLEKLSNKKFQLIFTTAYNEYALKAFKYSALHYLLKPLDIEDIKESLERAKKAQLRFSKDKVDKARFLYLKTEERAFNIDMDKILCLEADGSYSKIYLADEKTIFSSKNLGEFEKNLTDQFFRVHKSVIVNLAMIDSVDFRNNLVKLKGNKSVPISRRKKANFKIAIKAFQGEKNTTVY